MTTFFVKPSMLSYLLELPFTKVGETIDDLVKVEADLSTAENAIDLFYAGASYGADLLKERLTQNKLGN